MYMYKTVKEKKGEKLLNAELKKKLLEILFLFCCRIELHSKVFDNLHITLYPKLNKTTSDRNAESSYPITTLR
jgi:hypothetical protein